MKSSYTSQDVLFQLFRGCLLGTAVGDSLGLQAEALTHGTIRR